MDIEEIKRWRSSCDPDDIDFGRGPVLGYLDWLVAVVEELLEAAEVREAAYQAEIEARAKAEAALLAQSVVSAQVKAFDAAAEASLRFLRGRVRG